MKFFLVLIGIFILMVGGCEKGKKVTPPEEHTFKIEGVVVRDLNSRLDIASVSVQRDEQPFQEAQVKVNGHLLDQRDTTGTYWLMEEDLFASLSPCSLFVFSEPDSYTVQALAVMPGDFEIDYLWPEDRPYRCGGETHLPGIGWTISDSVMGYFVSVVGVEEADSAKGFAQISPYNERSAFIPLDAFQKKGTIEGCLPGPYVVWVVAYNRSFVSYYDIPFQIPDGLPEGNIEKDQGTFGGGVIAVTDTIWVTTGE